MPNDAILCRGLKKYYADVKAVDGLDLSIESGECFGLLGPNGAGKTTTIEILEGLTPADSGDVEVLGMTWRRNERALRERIGISLQETQFSEKVTVIETLRLFRSFYKEGPDPEELLRDLSLEEKRDARVGKLSGGQKQRLACACALVGDPDILFLDEPTTGLDPQSRLQLWDVVARFRQKGGTVLLTTHYMEEAERLCDRIAIIDHGKIIESGTKDDLVRRTVGARQTLIVEAASDLPAALAAELSKRGGQIEGALVRMPVRSPADEVRGVLDLFHAASVPVLNLTLKSPTLEQVFLQLTGRELRE